MGPEPFYDVWATGFVAEKLHATGQQPATAAAAAATAKPVAAPDATPANEIQPQSDVLEAEPNDTSGSATFSASTTE